MAISDFLDGWLARKTGSSTSLGRFLDPLADKLLIITSCILLALPATRIAVFEGLYLPLWVVVIIIGKDVYTLLGFLIIYLITAQMRIVPVVPGKISTTLQLCMVLAVLISPDVTPQIPAFASFVRFLWWATAAMAIVTIIVYTRKGTRHVLEFEQQNNAKQDTQQEDQGRSKY
jgi:phosphatidylglycerophosphate synthase